MAWFRRDNSAATSFLVSAAVWLVIGTVFGLLLTIEFVFPDFAKGIAQLVFPRLRQAHVNTVLFAWLSGAMMGTWLYMVPRLTGRKIYSELLGNLGVIAWNISVAIGIIAIMYGHTQSREYAEMIWGVDVAIMVVLLTNAYPDHPEAFDMEMGELEGTEVGMRHGFRKPDTADMIELYCSRTVGSSSCNDLDDDKHCQCPSCSVWATHGLGSYYYCLIKR